MATTCASPDTAQLPEMETSSTNEQVTTGQDDFTPEKLIEVIESLLESVRSLHRHGRPLIRKMASGKVKRHASAGAKTKRAFVVPVHVNADIANLFDLDPAVPIARADVTNKLNEYIKSNMLQLPDNRKHFRIDATFAKIFGLNEGETSNFFQMQKYINKVVTSAKNSGNAPANTAAPPSTEPPADPGPQTSSENPGAEASSKSAKPLKKIIKKK